MHQNNNGQDAQKGGNMDVSRFLLQLIILSYAFAFLSGCASKTSGVFRSPSNGEACSKQAIKNRFIIKWKDGRVSTVEAPDKEVFIETFLEPQLDEIESAEHDYRAYTMETIQVETAASSHFKTYHLNLVEANFAWQRRIYGKGVTIAVIDTGVDIHHPQLNRHLHTNHGEIPNNNIDDDKNGLVDDYQGYNFFTNSGELFDKSGHGTHVAGIALANHSQGDVKGVAPQATLLPLSFMGPDGSGRLSDAIKAIEYAVAQGAKVINASWGGGDCSSVLKQTIARLEKKDVLFITASGNEGVDIDLQPSFPAAFVLNSQITVGASNENDNLARFSNYSYNKTHLVAPGNGIYSTAPGGSTMTLSGTSMASPVVAGTVALLWSAFPSATSEQIKQAILVSVDKGSPAPVISEGRLNIRKALLALDSVL